MICTDMKTVKEEEQFLICMRHVDLAKIASECDVYARSHLTCYCLSSKCFNHRKPFSLIPWGSLRKTKTDGLLTETSPASV